MFKKFMSLFLAFALLIGQAPVAFAVDGEAAEDPVVIEQVISDEVSDTGEDASETPSDDEQGDLTETPDAAAEEPAVTIVSGTVAPDPGLPSNDELFEAYAEQVLYGTAVSAYGTAAGARLSGDEKLLYDALVPIIRQIAAGERASAMITVGQSAYGTVDTEVVFTAEQLTGENVANVVNALLSDLPYEMYWYDKVAGCGFSIPAYQITLSFKVAQSYRGADEYTADTSKTGLAADVAANAQAIVDKYANSADLDKLTAYKQEICSLVCYDDDAAASGNFSANSDSWQLINVFDNDTATNVVCEGYSKAFMYLCDMGDFTGDVTCYTVSGTMKSETMSGAHMWNIVTVDGYNYLADVTNSDSDTIGSDGSLFLVTAEGSVAEGYVINGAYFVYDAETIAMWGTDADSILALGANSNSGDAEDSDSGDTEEEIATSGTWGDNVTWEFDEETGTLTISGEGEMDGTLERDTPWRNTFDQDIINLVINEGITVIGTGAFSHCLNLKNIQIPDSVTTIGGAFYYCSSLTEIVIPSGVTTIGNSAFADCASLSSVTIPASVTSIGEQAFFLCTALTTVNYGGTKADWANITISDGNDPLNSATIVYTEEEVLSGICGENATWTFDPETDTLTISGTGVMYDYAGEFNKPWGAYREVIRTIIIESGITKVGVFAFGSYTALTDVSLPEGLIEIGDLAFNACLNLSNITIPSTVETIGWSAFYSCGIESIVIPEGVSVIAEELFLDCAQLKEITIPATVESIGFQAFLGCSALTTVYYDGSESDWANITISETGNEYLLNATIVYAEEEHVHDITNGTCECGMAGTCGENVTWEYDEETKTLTISGTGKMDNYASHLDVPWSHLIWNFETRKEIEAVVIGDGVTSIGSHALHGCGFDSLTIPESVTVIDHNAFVMSGSGSQIYYQGSLAQWRQILIGVGNLELVGTSTMAPAHTVHYAKTSADDNVPEALIEVSGAYGDLTWTLQDGFLTVSGNGEMVNIGNGVYAPWAIYQEHVNAVVIESGVTTVGDCAFTDMVNITSVSLPDGITKLGMGAFAGLSVPEYVIPDSVAEIGSSCFAYSAIERIEIPDSITTIGDYTFASCSELSEISIPANVTTIGEAAFMDCAALTTVNYGGTEEDWANVTISETGNDPLNSASIVYTAGNTEPKLFFHDVYWDDGLKEGTTDQTHYWTDPIADSDTKCFYFFDGSENIPLTVDDLIIGDTSILTMFPASENDAATCIDVIGFGETYIGYNHDGTEYRIPVTSQLPTFGFYSQTEATEANYLQEFTLSETNNALYFISRNEWTMKDVVLQNGGSDSTVTVSDDGKIVTIVLGESYSNNEWVELCFTQVSQSGNEWSDCRYSVRMKSELPHLVFYYGYFREGNQLTLEEGNPITRWNCTPHDCYMKAFLSVDGEEISIDPADLVSKNTDIVTVEVYENQSDFGYFNVCGFGETTITYTHTNGTTYSLPVSVGLPGYGFYSKPEATEANYLMDFTATAENDVVYFIGIDGCTITNPTLDNFPEGSTITVNDDGNIATITIGHEAMQDGRAFVNFTAVTPWDTHNSSFELKLSTTFPGIYYRDPSWDENGNPYEDLNNFANSSFHTFPKKGTFGSFYFFDGTTEHKLSYDDLYSDNEAVMRLHEDRGFPVMQPEGFGTANICYEHTDGTVYTLPTSVELFYVDFYSTKEASKETFIREFTVTNTNRTFYLAALDGFTINGVEPANNWPDSDITIAEDGSYATITIKDGAEWNENSGGSELSIALTGENGTNWSGHLEYIQLINGGNKMVFYWAYGDENGNIVPDKENPATAIWMTPGHSIIFPMMQIDGEKVAIDPTKLVSDDTDIVVITPDSDTGAVYLNFVGFGETTISYSHTDGYTYKMPVYINLPEVGFYSQPVAAEENYLREFMISDTNDTVYLVAQDGFSISNLEIYNLPEGSSYELNAAGTVATVKLAKIGYFGSIYASYSVTVPNGEVFDNWGSDLTINSAFPTFYVNYAQFDDDNELVVEDYMYTNWWMYPTKDILYPHMTINGEIIDIDPAKVKSSDESILTVKVYDGDSKAIVAEGVGLGVAYLEYTHTDNVTYKVSITVGLAELGFYTTPNATIETYIHSEDIFNLSEDNNVVYLISTLEWCTGISKIVELVNFPEGTVSEATDDPNVYKFTLGQYSADVTEPVRATVRIELTDVEGNSVNGGSVLNINVSNPCKDGHTVVTDAAVAVTCTTAGLTEGSHCDICGEVIVAQKPIPATGHYYDAGTVTAEPTCTTDGAAVSKCTVCGDTITARNLDEILVKRLISTAYMIAEAPIYDYGPEYILSRMVWKYDVDYTNRVFTVSAEDFEAEVGRYFTMDTMMIQMLREYAASLNPEYASIYYDAEANAYVIRIGGGFGGWNDERQYVGYVKNGGEYTAYYKTINYVYPSDVLPEGTDAYEYFEELGWPSSFEYGGYTFQNGPDGYYCIAGYEDSGRAVTMEFNDNVVRIVKVWDFTAAELPAEFDDVDGGMTGHIDNDGDYHCDVCKENVCASHVPTAIPAVDATCTATGLTEGTKCENCGKILEQQEVVGALGHTEVIDAAVAPTCTETGLTEGTKCSVCGEILEEQMIVPAKGHDFTNGACICGMAAPGGVYLSWAHSNPGENGYVLEDRANQELTSSVGAYDRIAFFLLYPDGTKEMVPLSELVVGNPDMLTLQSVDYTPDGYTCNIRGYDVGTTTISYGDYAMPVEVLMAYVGFYSSKEISAKNYIDSDYGEVNCRAFDVQEHGDTLYLAFRAPMTVTGITLPEELTDAAIVAVHDNGAYASITFNDKLPVTDDYGESYWMTINYVDQYGDDEVMERSVRIINQNGGTEEPEEPEHTHTEETIPAVDATCTADGLTEGAKCSVCGEITKEQEIVPMLAHNVSYVEAKAATYTAAGYEEHYKCNDCGALFLDALDAADNKPCTKADVIIPQLVEVTEGKAEVKEEVIEEAISNATETTVTLPLTEAAEDTVAAQLPVASLEKIAEAEKELTIETSFATVTMDTAALETIVAEAGDADSIELVVEEMATEELNPKQQTAVSKKKVAAVISAEILVNGDNVHDFDGGIVTVKIPFAIPEGGSPDNYYLVYVDEMGNIEEIPSKYENGYLVAELKHFSEYVIMDDSQPEEPTITRIAGAGRSDTAVKAADVLKAKLGVAKFDRIILANGLNFADALAGSYLAAVKSAPILLYSNAASVTLNEDYILSNLSADGVVYLLGGGAAVPQSVEDRLVDLGITVKRLYGSNRFGTNLEILEEAGVQPGSEILVATGLNFADSLSASATGKPILLVNGKGNSLTADQRAYLAQYGGGKITILGGTGAVSASIEAELRSYGEVNRLAGSSRYATSTLIAEEYFGAVDTVVIAYGLNFPDGLSGGPVAYAMNAPLVLTAAKSEEVAAKYVAANPVTNGYIMGGTGALSEETVNKIFGE